MRLAEPSRGITDPAQHLGQWWHGKLVIRRRGIIVVTQPEVGRIPAGHHGDAARNAHGGLANGLGKPHTTAGQAVQCGRHDFGVDHAKRVPALLVGHEKNNVRTAPDLGVERGIQVRVGLVSSPARAVRHATVIEITFELHQPCLTGTRGQSDMKCARSLADRMATFAQKKPRGAVVGMFEPRS